MEQKEWAAGFILVGGESKRMGEDKALLLLDGRPLLCNLIEKLRPHVAEVALIGPPARYAGFGVSLIEESSPGRGPLPALCAGLAWSARRWNLFLACDLPLLHGDFLAFLLRAAFASRAQAVIPQTADGWQPLCAVYHREALSKMERLEEKDAGIIEALGQLQVEVLTPERWRGAGFSERMFKNMNTPADREEIARDLERNKR